MAFIGNTNTTQAFTPAIDYFSGNGSTTAFTLSRPVASVAQVQVTIDNVAQNPSSAYTVSANTITFTSAPLSGTNNIYVYYTSPITQVIAPGQGTVTATSMASSTGTGAGVFQTSPTLVTPVLGVASATSITVAAGAVGTPSITTAGDTNTGIYFPAADTIAFSEGGAESMRIDASGNVLIATTNAITGITGVQLTASNTSENPAYINIFRDDTTIGNGQYLGYLQFCGRDATSSLGTGHAYVGAVAEADHGAGDNATAITFGTTPDNSSSMAERMRIDGSGNLKLTNSNNIASITSPAISLTGGTAGPPFVNGQSVNVITANSTARGVLIVSIATQACSAIFFINGGNAVNLSSQTTNETRFSATSGASNTANVFVSGSNIVLQNNIQASRDFYVTYIGQI